MHWSHDAEKAVSRVPFFVRKRVKRKVEEEAQRCGADRVELGHVEACQKRFLNKMEEEVKGYQIESCFGSGGCPNRIGDVQSLLEEIETLVAGKNLRSVLQRRVKGPLKLHHEFRISVSDCPNSCSRPQIVDVGLIGAHRPQVSHEPCSHCSGCIDVCREQAITLDEQAAGPSIDREKCLACGQCIRVCPTGTLSEGKAGYRIQVGGKLGRHPQLGSELPGIYSAGQALKIVDRCLELYLEHNTAGERFGEILNRVGIKDLQKNAEERK